MKNISILGSTGSIGCQTLEIIRENPDKYRVVGLSANTNIEKLLKQIEEFSPLAVAVADPVKADELKRIVDITVYSGESGIRKIAVMLEADLIVNALVGSSGILPTLDAINAEKEIALANKETLVVAGEIIMDCARKKGIEIIPIDSEHMGLFQCLEGRRKEDIKKLTLTASGGPFRDYSNKIQFDSVSAEMALQHPNWKMGPKNTIDSATLMNKGNEMIEAMHLFGIEMENIDAVMHRQSIVHALVEFNDGNILANLSLNDMRYPIQYALSQPARLETRLPALDLKKIGKLSFEELNVELFPCLNIAKNAARIGGTMPAVMNAANEIAVSEFLRGHIRFKDIPLIISGAMDDHTPIKNPDIDEIMDVDKRIRRGLTK